MMGEVVVSRILSNSQIRITQQKRLVLVFDISLTNDIRVACGLLVLVSGSDRVQGLGGQGSHRRSAGVALFWEASRNVVPTLL